MDTLKSNKYLIKFQEMLLNQQHNNKIILYTVITLTIVIAVSLSCWVYYKIKAYRTKKRWEKFNNTHNLVKSEYF